MDKETLFKKTNSDARVNSPVRSFKSVEERHHSYQREKEPF